jgi:hypothetical protein
LKEQATMVFLHHRHAVWDSSQHHVLARFLSLACNLFEESMDGVLGIFFKAGLPFPITPLHRSEVTFLPNLEKISI